MSSETTNIASEAPRGYDAIPTDEHDEQPDQQQQAAGQRASMWPPSKWPLQKPYVAYAVIDMLLFALANLSTATAQIEIFRLLACAQMGYNTPEHSCKDPVVERLYVRYTTIMTLAYTGIAAITALIYGNLSNIYGRRIVIIISAAGLLINHMITAMTGWFELYEYGFGLAFLGIVINGICGSEFSVANATRSYVVDLSPPLKRSRNLGFVAAAMLTAVSAGPTAGGKVVQYFGGDPFAAAYFGVLLGFLNLFYAIWIPESTTKEQRHIAKVVYDRSNASEESKGYLRMFFEALASSFGSLRLFLPNKSTGWTLTVVGVTALFTTTGGAAINSLLTYVGYVFDWSALETAYLLSYLAVTRFVVLICIVPGMTAFLNWYHRQRLSRGQKPVEIENESASTRQGPLPSTPSDDLIHATQEEMTEEVASLLTEEEYAASITSSTPSRTKATLAAAWADLQIARMAYFTDCIAFIVFGNARNGGGIYAGTTMLAFGAGGAPGITSFALSLVRPDQTGTYIAAAAFLESLCFIFAPLMYSVIYSMTIETLPSTFFFVSAVLYGFGLVCTMFLSPKRPKRGRHAV